MNKTGIQIHIFTLAVVFCVMAVQACQFNPSSRSEPAINIISPLQGIQINAGDNLEVVYHAEDNIGIKRVEMVLGETMVAVQKVPLPQGQTPLDGILYWTPKTAGSYNLLLRAYNTEDIASQPAALSIIVAASPEISTTNTTQSSSGLTKTPEASPAPISQNETKLQLPLYTPFDLDRGTRLSGNGIFMDIQLGTNDANEIQLEPVLLNQGIKPKLVIWGHDEPTYNACLNAALTTDPILLDKEIFKGTYVCFQTGEGQYGYLFADKIVTNSEIGEQVLMASYALWNNEGNERIVSHSLHVYAYDDIDNGAGCDLDYWNNSQTTDVSFAIVGDGIQVSPLGKASLAFWGTSFPSREDCESQTFNTEPIIIHKNNLQEQFDKTYYFCYQTNRGNIGRLEVIGAEEDPGILKKFYNTDISQITFAYDTWE